MTRTYALKRLLEHGPLTFAEMVQICGWAVSETGHALECLCKQGIAVIDGHRDCKRVYRLAD